MRFEFVKKIINFLQSTKGAAIVETSFILPILIFLLIFCIEIHLLGQARQGIMILADSCAFDFGLSGRTNTFEKHIAKLPSILFGIDDVNSINKKLRYYIHLNAYVEDIHTYPLFFDNDGDGKFTAGNDELLSKSNENILNSAPSQMYIGMNTWSVYGKKFNRSYDDEFCFFDAADLQITSAYERKMRFGVIVFVYKFKFIFPFLRHLIVNTKSNLDYIPIIGVSSVIRDY